MNISSVPVGDQLFGKINCKATGRALLTLLLSRDLSHCWRSQEKRTNED
jgi:hypothetical protein